MCHEYSPENWRVSRIGRAAIYETWSVLSTGVEFAPL
jgi:hypothetical protein